MYPLCGPYGALSWLQCSCFISIAELEKNEDDQIFLDDSFDHERAAQSAIVAKVQKVEFPLRVAKWLALAMSVVVVIYYIRDIMVQLDIIH